MSDELTRPRITLKFWEGAGDLLKLAGVFDAWWDKVQSWLKWLTLQVDADTAPLILVNLLAWQRDVDRFPGEPETLYRKRVKFALANALDAGCSAGFSQIWERLGLGYLGQDERLDPVDWDVIALEMTENMISEQPELLEIIIRKYGRTCRRYSFTTITPVTCGVRAFDFDGATLVSVAKAQDKTDLALRIRPAFFDNDTNLIVAKEQA